MLTILEKHKSGWVGISFAFRRKDIDALIEHLIALKSGQINHFHFRTDDFSKEEGIADVEISLQEENEADNMWIK
jgi:hypothetical protein